MTTKQEIFAAAENADLSEIFENAYPDLYTDDCDPDLKLLLYWDLDEKEFGFKNDEQGQYRSAFESQNNVVTICYVDPNTALTREMHELVQILDGNW